MKKQKENLNETLYRMKKLFIHERGVVISEQIYQKSNLIKEDTSDIVAGAATGAAIGSFIPGVGTVIGAGVGALGAWLATKDSGPQERVKAAFDMCNKIPADKQGEKTVDPYSLADNIYNAINGAGTDEEALGTTFSQMKSIADICAVKKAYESTYSKDIFGELDGDIDSDNDWLIILRPLRGILDAQAELEAKSQQTQQEEIIKWGDGSEISKCLSQFKKDGHKVEVGKSDDGTEYVLITYTDTSLKPGYYYKDGELSYEDVNKPGEYITKKWSCTEQPDGNGRYTVQYI